MMWPQVRTPVASLGPTTLCPLGCTPSGTDKREKTGGKQVYKPQASSKTKGHTSGKQTVKQAGEAEGGVTAGTKQRQKEKDAREKKKQEAKALAVEEKARKRLEADAAKQRQRERWPPRPHLCEHIGRTYMGHSFVFILPSKAAARLEAKQKKQEEKERAVMQVNPVICLLVLDCNCCVTPCAVPPMVSPFAQASRCMCCLRAQTYIWISVMDIRYRYPLWINVVDIRYGYMSWISVMDTLMISICLHVCWGVHKEPSHPGPACEAGAPASGGRFRSTRGERVCGSVTLALSAPWCCEGTRKTTAAATGGRGGARTCRGAGAAGMCCIRLQLSRSGTLL